MSTRTFDMGDPEPEDVQQLVDYRADAYDADVSWYSYWCRTKHYGWKGYTDGDKTYIEWDELVRRYGPLREEKTGEEA